jgi:hypothetical protein
MNPLPAPASRLSPEEQQRRRESIEQGITQVRLEGLSLPVYYWEYAERYICGEITLDEMRSQLLQRFMFMSR